ncbi:MAG TPA: PAS domain S-box protein [Gaiellaceae bacterium]
MSRTEPGLGDDLRRMVIERSHDLVTVLDLEGRIVYASPTWQTMLGWEPAEVLGTPLTDYCHPADLERGLAAIATQVAGEQIPPIVTRRRTKDGGWLYIESNASPVFDAEGNVTHLMGSARNVTEAYELRARVDDLNALYKVADAVARAATLDELFEEALDALIAATAAERAALLLSDAGGVMRFRASRGLSDAYRIAAEGHSPWPPGTADPAPVLISDVSRSDLEPELAAVVVDEGIAALAFVPLVHLGRLLGKFMLYTAEPHAWEEREIRLCVTIANHLASATVRMQTGEQFRAQRERLETIMRTVDEGIIVQARDGRRIYANEGAARTVGFGSAEEFLRADRDEVLGRFEILDEHGQPIPPEGLPGRVALAGETAERLVCYRIRATGEERWSIVRANPIRDDSGAVVASVSVIHDITDRRAAELQAREAAALVEGVFRNAPVGLAFWDSELRYQRVNDELVEINGIPAEETVGRNVFEVFPNFESQLAATLRHVLDTGEPVVGREVVGETPAQPGVQRVWRSSWYPVRDTDGEILGVGGIVDEITLERRAGDRIRLLARASELLNQTLDMGETFRALADLVVPAFAGHVTVDLYDEGVLRLVGARHVDPALSELLADLRLRYPPTVADHPVQHALRSGEPQVVRDVQAAAETMAHDPEHVAGIRKLANESGIVVPLIARDRTFGAITFGSVPPQPVFDEEDLELAIELGRRASAALDNALLYEEAQARAHAADALEFVDDGVFLVDRDGIVRLWNPAAAKTFRVRAERALGRHVTESIADWDTLWEQTHGARGVRAFPMNVRGAERWLSASAVSFGGGTVFAFRDLTEQHAIEQVRSDFVSTVSHELRTPLAAIYGAALTLQRDDVRLEESQRSGLLSVIASEADRLARIVNDILWASRLDSGQMGIAIEKCDAEAIAMQVAKASRAHAPDGIRLDVDAEPNLPSVAADPDKLRQVLTNLVDNGIKYSPDGGHVYVLVTRSGNRIRFRVQDEGLGVPPAEQARIFEKFFRLDPQLTRGVGGTGLGLYICRELVQRMGGRIGVNSDGRSGSTFWVELPVAG